MKLWSLAVCIPLTALLAGQSQDKIYSGARIDAASTAQAHDISAGRPDLDVTVYTTADPFEKVFAAFQKKGREFKVIGSRTRKLPNGQELRDAFFLLDNALDLASSRRWVKLQRPYLGQYGLARNSDGQYDIRDVTAIVLSVKK